MAIQPKAQEAALAHLRSIAVAGGMLPSLRVLARNAGVAYVSMHKTVRRLALAGYLTVVKKKGIQIVRPLPTLLPPPARPAVVRGWRQLAQRLRHDIMDGRFLDPPELPSLKQLASRYCSCYATARKSLQALLDEGMLIPYRKRYRIPGFTLRRSPNTLALVSVGNAEGYFFDFTQLRNDMVRQLEIECIRQQIRLKTYILPFTFGQVNRCPELLKIAGGSMGESLLGIAHGSVRSERGDHRRSA